MEKQPSMDCTSAGRWFLTPIPPDSSAASRISSLSIRAPGSGTRQAFRSRADRSGRRVYPVRGSRPHSGRHRPATPALDQMAQEDVAIRFPSTKLPDRSQALTGVAIAVQGNADVRAARWSQPPSVRPYSRRWVPARYRRNRGSAPPRIYQRHVHPPSRRISARKPAPGPYIRVHDDFQVRFSDTRQVHETGQMGAIGRERSTFRATAGKFSEPDRFGAVSAGLPPPGRPVAASPGRRNAP